MRWMLRQIEAPASDSLSAQEVAALLGYRDKKSVYDLVKKGLFPEGIDDGAGGKEWLWEDVVWFMLSKRIRARLRKGSDDETESETDEPEPAPRKGK